MMNDFNQMCADMEDGLSKNTQDLKTGLNKAAQDLKTGLDKNAQDAAAATAALAKANAAYAPDQPPTRSASIRAPGRK